MRFMMGLTQSSKRKVNLSVKDKKLVQLLVNDGRISVSELAKKVGISKPAVSKKISSLTEKGVLLSPVLYSSFDLRENKNLYVFKVYTSLGINTSSLTEKIRKIKGVAGVLWYSGEFNLFIVVDSPDPQLILEVLEELVPINKIKILKIKDMWFHPPHLFKEIPNVKLKFERKFLKYDEKDERIIAFLHHNPRATLVEISSKVKLSVLTVKKKINLMIKNGLIKRFSYFVSPWFCGKEIVSVSFVCKGRKNTDVLLSKLLNFPEAGNVWEMDHEMNVNAVFWVDGQNRINEILNDVYKNCKGILETQILVLTGMSGN